MVNPNYIEQHGRLGKYFWLESNGIRISEVLSAFPQIVEGKYVLRTYFNSENLIPYGEPPGLAWEKWFEHGLLGIVASAEELKLTDYDELFIYSDCPDPSSFAILKDVQLGLSSSSLGEAQTAETFLRYLSIVSPDSYITGRSLFRYLTSDKAAFDEILGSRMISTLATKHEVEAEKELQDWRKTSGQELGPEQCASPGCQRLRIRLSVHCARHHIDMLKRTASDFG